MKSPAKKKKTPEELWRTLEEQAMNDEMDRILALSNEELDAELRSAGFDPAVERALGPKQAKEAAAKVVAGEEQAEKLRAARQRLAERRARRGPLDRTALLERISIAQDDPRLPAPATMLFRNRKTTEATDKELEAMLDQLEDLIAAYDEDPKA